MGRKRYFCDYCSKNFAGDPKGRALHLNSARHIQIRQEYYANFTDPEEILGVESQKPTCPYLERGCKFGVNCNFSHYHPEQLRILQAAVDNRRNVNERPMPTFSEWRTRKIQTGFAESRISHNIETAPSFLPLSLQPIDVADFVAAEFSEWGE